MAIKACCFDIETTHLCADFGIVLCACVKPDGGDTITFRGDKLIPGWKSKRSNDALLVAKVAEELSKYEIWVAHNGKRFDMPFLNTRLLRAGLKPLINPKVLVDPVELARNKLRMTYNSLEKLATHLGVNSKTDVDPAMWLAATLDGDVTALDYIVDHCQQDVVVLEHVTDKLKDLSSGFNGWGSGR